MEARKRKPLSDITNAYNLIPTSTLRKLVAVSSGSNSISKQPVSILKSNSSSKNQKIGSDSSNRSETSIGSSNVSAAGNSRTVQFRTPPCRISSLTSQGGIRSKDAAHDSRQTIQKSQKERDATLLIVSPNAVEKRKDKGKAIAIPLSPSPPEKIKDNLSESGKGILNSYSSSYERIEKGKQIVNSSGSSVEKQEELGKGIAGHSSGSLKKRNKKEKEFVIPSSFSVGTTEEKEKPLNPSSNEKTREKGKAIMQPSSVVDITKHKGSSDAVVVYSRPPRRKSERRNNDTGASSCPPVLKTKNIQNDLNEARDIKALKSWTDPRPKCRKRRCSSAETTSELPLDFIEQQRAYFKEVDEFELPEEEASQDDLD
ncbi:hypothetical protein CDL12_06828 [Handroanthus impetiginosus]|uniref:Sororin C-terminal region domain-containing protein n=1 Tax=Handroanthus impetiginosus TaxID=429701 RepID=A0A2G9HSJ1_9LAMI|nr:hypothetical protein CDL12_06828 [Handroanthus impetiginosus]